MRTDATGKLLKGLTGKELFQAVMATYLERWQQKEPTFSDADLDKAIVGLFDRPEEWRAYEHWWEANHIMDTFKNEMRVMAMEGVWRITVFMEDARKHLIPKKSMKEAGESLLAQLPEFQATAKRLQAIIDPVGTYYAMLEAFGDVWGCNIPILVQWEYDLLQAHIKLYNKMADWLDDDLMFAQYCQGKDIDSDEVNTMPCLSLNPTAADTKKRLIQAIEDGGKASFWNITDALWAA